MAISSYIPVKDDFRNMFLTTKFELLKHVKRKRILITLILAILISLIFFTVPPLLGQEYADTANGFASSNLGFINMLIIISGAIFAGDCISGEFDKKTLLAMRKARRLQHLARELSGNLKYSVKTQQFFYLSFQIKHLTFYRQDSDEQHNQMKLRQKKQVYIS